MSKTSIRDQLGAAEDRLRKLREERGRLSKVFESAKSAAAENETDATLGAALSAKEAIQQVEQQIEAATEDQTSLLKRLGDAEAGRVGWASPSANAYRDFARQVDLTKGQTRLDTGAAAFLRPMAQAPAGGGGDGGSVPPVSVQTPDGRVAARTLLYPWALPQEPLPVNEFSSSDFTVSVDQSALSGVERDVDATSTKADLGATVALAQPQARMFAVTAQGIPQRVFFSQSACQALLEQELRRRIDLEVDEHLVGAIESAAPPSGSSGADLIAKVRNAVAAHRQLGSSPSVLALSPSDGASLDLTKESGSGAYVFVIRGQGADVLWTLTVVESEAVTDPLLIDPARLGVLMVGSGSIVADPLTGLTTNTVRLRCEVECVAHVRSVVGAYVIA